MKKGLKIFAILLVVFIALQFWKPEEIEYSTPTKDLTNVPAEVNTILRNSCFDCHSNTANLAWFDKITPANFIVTSHITDGRKALNFSDWDKLEKPKQSATLFYAFNKILSGEMPLKSYTALHPSAQLDDRSIGVLKNYLTTIAVRKPNQEIPSISTAKDVEKVLPNKKITDYSKVKPTLNNIAYIPDFRNWKAVSTSDRFDNGSMRIIYGNEIAVKAIAEHQTNPWPDGAIFAKTAWKQKTEADGTVSAGAFIQVEFMIKDSKKYEASKGWGWARWKGNDLKPYGDNANFDQECISCHNPVKNNDYVFTTPLHLDINKFNIYNKTK
ncbi:Haem-binding domain-containing protein [Flavobacterium sp. CF108]|uniref:cytochrome P460 family protein n=1 Tax=unclassified Flavobacterium TaxID=196869 RepID=UPI0008D6981C|nr:MULTISPECIES: cytochrome P460 family protein [unclassified Flavobacterium]SEO18332.1 Haem-binding domain-containing protein [Flavobacterium sp. fv08]SHG54866.1 Haem-binding domain-containing protein [Flavobacterium sp. CF108]